MPIYESYTGHHTREGNRSLYLESRTAAAARAAPSANWAKAEITDSSGRNNCRQRRLRHELPRCRMRAELYEKKYFANSALSPPSWKTNSQRPAGTAKASIQRDEGIRVLEATGMPSVLIETGFLSQTRKRKNTSSATTARTKWPEISWTHSDDIRPPSKATRSITSIHQRPAAPDPLEPRPRPAADARTVRQKPAE